MPKPLSVDTRARESLQFVREVMTRTLVFRNLPAWEGAMMGVLALIASSIAYFVTDPVLWLLLWIATALLGLGLGLTTVLGSDRGRVHSSSMAFLMALTPALLTAVVLTAVLFWQGLNELLPGCWLLLYGVAVIAASTHSLPLLRNMGMAFMVLGIAAFIAPIPEEIFMAAGFGGLQIFYGIQIARQQR